MICLMSTKKSVLVISLLLSILVACVPETAMPTQAVMAVVPEVTATNSVAETADDLPITWTPHPADIEGEQITSFVRGPGTPIPSRTASATPFIPTLTPRPTATPTPSNTPPPTATSIPAAPQLGVLPSTLSQSFSLPQVTGSKLGIHIIRNNDADIMNFIRDGQPSVIKALDDFGYLAEAKRVSPNTVIIGRVDDIYSQNYIGEPEDAARVYVEKHLDQYYANPAVDFWEGWNEPDPNMDNMPWYARFEQERVRVMASYGLRTAIGGFAAGVPEMDEFRLFVPAIETALRYGGILTLHEYSAPDMMHLYGGALPGYPAYPDRGALTFRYRWFYREILEPAGLVIPLAITEAGIDGIIGNRPGPQGKGWRDFTGYWVRQGLGSNGEQAFLNQLAWYDKGVREDSYVIGFTIFTAGGFGYWENYNINSILPDLTNYVRSQ